jgi:hypothetical protein
MSKILHTIRSRRFRLLASWLVMLAILCNGIGFVQAQSTLIKKDCCAEMMAHKTASAHCVGAAKHDSTPKANCDDQCKMHCSTVNYVSPTPITIAPSLLVASALPTMLAAQLFLARIAPELRPPISA